MSFSFLSESYSLHANEIASRCADTPNIIGRPCSIDAWRHLRMYAHLQPIIDHHPAGSWLTVGDSGADAFFLRSAGVRNVTATCISDAALRSLAGQGHLRAVTIRAENAERLELPDESVDFVLCKEAYHHFPRPPIAFYEMLRVCRTAVVLIEPLDNDGNRPLDIAKKAAKQLLRGDTLAEQLFEDTGNYIFRLSPAEVAKMAAALQLPLLAHRHFNDFFALPIAARDQRERWPMLLQTLGLGIQDALCRLRLLGWGLTTMLVFKTPPDEEMLASLRRRGFTVQQVPRNPRRRP